MSERRRMISSRWRMSAFCMGESRSGLFMTSRGVVTLPMSWSQMLMISSSLRRRGKGGSAPAWAARRFRKSVKAPPYRAMRREWLAL